MPVLNRAMHMERRFAWLNLAFVTRRILRTGFVFVHIVVGWDSLVSVWRGRFCRAYVQCLPHP